MQLTQSKKHLNGLSLSHVFQHLENVSFQDMMAKFHGLLAVQLPLSPGQHEGHDGMAAPVESNICKKNWESEYITALQ